MIQQSSHPVMHAGDATERIHMGHLLDANPWSVLQKMVVLLSAMTIIFDGMDIQMMGFAVPAIAKEWGVARSVFAPILGLGLLGVTVGAGLGGLMGDRIGRRRSILMSVLVFAAATLGFAFAHTMTALFVLRTIAGLGIGGALPNVTTMAAEFTPSNRRPLAVTCAIVCIPLGGVVAGLIAAKVLASGSWRVLFYIGGGAPLVLLLALLFALPESPRYLARLPQRRNELVKLLSRMRISVPEDAWFIDETPSTSGAEGGAFSEIFGKGTRGSTFAIWAAFFCSLLAVYLVINWLPSVLAGLGLDLGTASQALAAWNFGGIFGALLFGWWISRRGSRAPLLVGTLAGLISAVMVRLVPIHRTGDHVLLLSALTLNGLFLNAVQTTLYALAAHIYTTKARATGVAGALVVGRSGAIVSAFLGASLLAYGSNGYFVTIAVTMAGVFVALAVLRRHIEPPSSLPLPVESELV